MDSCTLGIERVILKANDSKSWFKFKAGDKFVEILDSPNGKINRTNAYGVAVSYAKFINKKLNEGRKNIGDILYPEQEGNRVFVKIAPTVKQRYLINAESEADIQAIEKEIAEEEAEKNLNSYPDTRETSSDEMYSLSTEDTNTKEEPKGSAESLSPGVFKKVSDVLDKMGVSVTALTDYVKTNPNVPHNANAVANLAKKVIALSEGIKEVVLIEEMVHIATAMIELTNPQLMTDLIKQIEQYPIYDRVHKAYSETYLTPAGKPDIRRIKKEAIDQLIAQTILNKETSDTNSTSTPIGWWNSILSFINNLFTKTNINLFEEIGESIITGNFETTALKDTGEYYNLSPKQEEIQKRILASQDVNAIRKIEQDDTFDPENPVTSFYEVRDEEGTWHRIKSRVTDRVKKEYEKMFPDSTFTKEEQEYNDFKKDHGILFHGFFEDIVAKYFNADGTARDKQIPSKLDLNTNDQSVYNKLEDYFLKTVAQHEENGEMPLVFSEVIIYEGDNKGKGEAGTIDLLIVDKKGKASIIDWKFQSFSKSQEDIAWYKKNAYTIQLGRYREMLFKTYGVKEFKHIRAIPIELKIKNVFNIAQRKHIPVLEKVKVGDLDAKEVDLLTAPFSVEGEQTGNKTADELITTFTRLKKATQDKSPKNDLERANKANLLHSLELALRSLYINQNIVPSIMVLKDLVNNSEELKTLYDTLFRDGDASDSTLYTDEVLSEFSENSISFLNNAEFLVRTSNLINKSLSDSIKLEKDPAIKAQHKILLSQSEDFARELNLNKEDVRTNLENFTEKFIARRTGVFDIMKAEKIVKKFGLGTLFEKASRIPLKSVQILVKTINSKKLEAEKSTNDKVKTLSGIFKDLQDKYGSSLKDTLAEKLYFKDTEGAWKNRLIGKYSKEFYDEAKKAKLNNDTEWFLNNIDLESYEKKAKEDFERRITFLEKKYADSPFQLKKIIEKEEKQWDLHSPDFNGWSNKVLTFFPGNKWVSKEYTELSGDKELFALYNYIIGINKEAASTGYISTQMKNNFLPFVKKGFVESLSDFSFNNVGNVLNDFIASPGDTQFGKIDEVTLQVQNALPTFFTSDFAGAETDLLSKELFKNLILYTQSVEQYKALSSIEGQINAVKTIESFKDHIETTRNGNVVLEGGKVKTAGGNTANVDVLDLFIKSMLYQQSNPLNTSDGSLTLNFKKTINTMVGKEVFVDPKPTSLSAIKTVETINKLFQTKVLGLSIVPGIANAFGINIQLSQLSGRFFEYKDFSGNELKLLQSKFQSEEEKEKFLKLIETFAPLKDSLFYEDLEKMGMDKINRVNYSDLLFVFLRKPEVLADKALFMTLLDNTMVVNGKLVNIREFVNAKYSTEKWGNNYSATKQKIDEEIKQLKENRSISKIAKVEKDELVIPGFSLDNSNEIFKLNNLHQAIFTRAAGNTNREDPSISNMGTFFKSFMVFKNWIPSLVNVRFAAFGKINNEFGIDVDEDSNITNQSFDVGNVRLLLDLLITPGGNRIRNILDILNVNDGGVLAMDNLYNKYAEAYKKKTGEDLEMNKEMFYEMVHNNLRNQFRELALLLTLISLSFAGGMLKPEDEKDRATKNAYRYTMKILDKLTDEIRFFYNPLEIQEMLSKGGIFPAIGLVTDIYKFLSNLSMEITGIDYTSPLKDREEVLKDAHPAKYFYKLNPLTNQWMIFSSLFDEEFAKEHDITVQ